MFVVMNEHTSAAFNHAAEEYLMNTFTDDIFMLWRAERAILIGACQNALAEVDVDYVKEHDIEVVRRTSGGGTVFCDLGNTNFSFIKSAGEVEKGDFKQFVKPILDLLESLFVPAEFTGRNDILVDGKKVSGNAQYRTRDRMLHHGTLLYSADLSVLAKALTPHPLKYQAKGVKSVRARVGNIQPYVEGSMDIQAFRHAINQYILAHIPGAVAYHFTDKDIEAIEKIAANKFGSWDWTYGRSPKVAVQNAKKLDGGVVETAFEVKNGKLKGVRFFGDFLCKREIETVEGLLEGVSHEKDAIASKLNTLVFDDYFYGIGVDEIVELLL